jgi:hypothetical protein
MIYTNKVIQAKLESKRNSNEFVSSDLRAIIIVIPRLVGILEAIDITSRCNTKARIVPYSFHECVYSSFLFFFGFRGVIMEKVFFQSVYPSHW